MDFKYIYYRYVDALINRLSEKILKKKIIQNKCGSKQIISKEACNSKIFDAICNNRPYMVARYGSTEMLAICGFIILLFIFLLFVFLKRLGLYFFRPQQTLTEV